MRVLTGEPAELDQAALDQRLREEYDANKESEVIRVAKEEEKIRNMQKMVNPQRHSAHHKSHREASKGSDAASYKSQASRGNKFAAGKDAMAGSGFNVAAGSNRVPSERSGKQSTASPNTGLAGTKYAESPSRRHTSKFEETSP